MYAFQIIGKTPLPSVSGLSACEIREYSAARSSEFTSSSTFYEFVKMKRANPSFPPDVINARENVSSRP